MPVYIAVALQIKITVMGKVAQRFAIAFSPKPDVQNALIKQSVGQLYGHIARIAHMTIWQINRECCHVRIKAFKQSQAFANPCAATMQVVLIKKVLIQLKGLA